MRAINELFRIFTPLLILYVAGFILVYTSIGQLLGVRFPPEALFIKVSTVIVVSLIAVWFTYRRIDLISSNKQVRLFSKSILVAITAILIVVTPLLADSLEVSY